MHELRMDAIARLSHEFPSTLDGRDNWTPRKMVDIHLMTDLFNVVRLGRENGVLFILPWAMAVICGLCSPEQIYKGAVGKDGDFIALGPEDQLACLSGWRTLAFRKHDETSRWLHSSTSSSIFSGCRIPFSCRSAMTDILMNSLSHKTEFMVNWPPTWDGGMCKSCASTFKLSYEESRQKLWEILPSVFGLPAWDELLETRYQVSFLANVLRQLPWFTPCYLHSKIRMPHSRLLFIPFIILIPHFLLDALFGLCIFPIITLVHWIHNISGIIRALADAYTMNSI